MVVATESTDRRNRGISADRAAASRALASTEGEASRMDLVGRVLRATHRRVVVREHLSACGTASALVAHGEPLPRWPSRNGSPATRPGNSDRCGRRHRRGHGRRRRRDGDRRRDPRPRALRRRRRHGPGKPDRHPTSTGQLALPRTLHHRPAGDGRQQRSQGRSQQRSFRRHPRAQRQDTRQSGPGSAGSQCGTDRFRDLRGQWPPLPGNAPNDPNPGRLLRLTDGHAGSPVAI